MAPERRSAAASWRGFWLSLGGVALVSTNFVTAKYALGGFNPETFSLLWCAAAAFYAFVLTALSAGRTAFRVPRGAWGAMALLGFATAAGMIWGWAGLALLDPSFSAFIWRFAPVLTVLLGAAALGERMRATEIAPFAVMILGGAWSAWGRWEAVGKGVVYTLLACAVASVQMVVAKRKARAVHPNMLVFCRVGLSVPLLAAWLAATGRADFDVPRRFWAALLLGAFLGPCASFLLTFRSLRYWSLSRTTVVQSVQPMIVLPLAALVLGELPTRREFAGGLLILAGSVWFVWLHLFGRRAREAAGLPTPAAP